MRVKSALSCLLVVVTGLVAVSTRGVATAATSVLPVRGPLAGRTVVLDPGHQLGNSNPRFAKQLSQTFFNGAITKGCNTSGTATNAGFPEATFAWRVAQRLKAMLERAGATVILTRSSNSYQAWGPCVWERAQIANRANADVMVSIHGDGAPSAGKGFFAIAPTLIAGWTDDVVKVDRRLANAMIDGMKSAGAPGSTYVRDQLLLSSTTTSLNVSNVPTTTIELGNMRNPSDARRMSSSRGQQQYADWLYAGVMRFLGR